MLPNSQNRYIKSSKLKAVNISSTASLPDPKNVQLLLIHGVPKDEIIVPQCCEIRCLSAKTLTAELKQKNARTAVRRDFIVAHPRPKMRMIFENITNFRAIPLHQSDNIPKRIGNSYDHYGKFAGIMYLYDLESRRYL